MSASARYYLGACEKNRERFRRFEEHLEHDQKFLDHFEICSVCHAALDGLSAESLRWLEGMRDVLHTKR